MNQVIARRAGCVLLVCMLAACGGGSETTERVSNSTDTGGAAPTAATQAQAYLGTFVGQQCFAPTGVVANATGAQLYERTTFTGVSVAGNRVMLSVQHNLYASVDCSGAPVWTSTVAGTGTYLDIDAAGTGAGGSDKVTLAEADRLPGFGTANNVVVNGVRLPADYRAAYRDLQLARLVAQQLFVGDLTAATDAQGYPTRLNSTASFVKQ